MDWNNIAPMVVLSIGFLSAAAVFIFRGPLGKALAERIAGRQLAADPETQRLRQDVDELRAELGAVQERLDFAERLLARERERATLRPGS